MIKPITAEYIGKLGQIFPNSPFLVKILTNIYAYGNEYPFAQTRVQLNEKNEVTAVFSDIEGNRTVIMNDNADIDELKIGISFFTCKALLGSEHDLKKLGFPFSKTGDILQYFGNKKVYEEYFSPGELKPVYELLNDSRSESIITLDYLFWLSDVTYKRNRSLLRVCTLYENDEICSLVMTSGETQNGALISGVATKKEYRRKGYMTRLLLSVCTKLKSENKDIFLLTVNPDLNRFYEKTGFKAVGKWAVTEVLG